MLTTPLLRNEDVMELLTQLLPWGYCLSLLSILVAKIVADTYSCEADSAVFVFAVS